MCQDGNLKKHRVAGRERESYRTREEISLGLGERLGDW
jgi:hypothetical protein